MRVGKTIFLSSSPLRRGHGRFMSQETVRWTQSGQLLTHKMPEKPFRISFHILFKVLIRSSYSKFYSGLFSGILAIKKRSWVFRLLSHHVLTVRTYLSDHLYIYFNNIESQKFRNTLLFSIFQHCIIVS